MITEKDRRQVRFSRNYGLDRYFYSSAGWDDMLWLPDRPKPWPLVDTKGFLSLVRDDGSSRAPWDHPYKGLRWYLFLHPEGIDLGPIHINSLPKFLTEQAAESALTKLSALMLGGVAAPIVGGALAALVPGETTTTQTINNISDTRNLPVTTVLAGFNL